MIRKNMPAPAKATLAYTIPALNSSELDDGNARVRRIAAVPMAKVPRSCNTLERISGHRRRALDHNFDKSPPVFATRNSLSDGSDGFIF